MVRIKTKIFLTLFSLSLFWCVYALATMLIDVSFNINIFQGLIIYPMMFIFFINGLMFICWAFQKEIIKTFK
tara:strand:+ start:278 stop:493 length:216 start_codon:yes stop_codon:yes gene_type:complete